MHGCGTEMRDPYTLSAYGNTSLKYAPDKGTTYEVYQVQGGLECKETTYKLGKKKNRLIFQIPKTETKDCTSEKTECFLQYYNDNNGTGKDREIKGMKPRDHDYVIITGDGEPLGGWGKPVVHSRNTKGNITQSGMRLPTK